MIGVDWIPIGCDIQAFTENEKAALAILNDGKSYFHIAYKMHVSFERAREIIFSIRRKESLIMGKLTNTQRAAIFQAWKDGTTPKELAKQYGVSVKAIYNLINKMKKDPPQELEDCENGIPNTPLVPAEIEKEISEIAEEDKPKPGIINQEFDAAVDAMIAESKSADAEEPAAIAEPEKLPGAVRRALDAGYVQLLDEIAERREQIEELQAEITEFEKDIAALKKWVEGKT